MSDWFEDDELFFRQLEVGHQHAQYVAERLRAAGLVVELTPMVKRARVEDRGDFVDEYDLMVGQRAPCVVDVKSRDLEFRGPADYPYTTAFVDTVTGWAAKATKPHAIVLVSQRTRGLAVIPVRTTEATWGQTAKFDRVREIDERFYTIERNGLVTFRALVTWLTERDRRSDVEFTPEQKRWLAESAKPVTGSTTASAARREEPAMPTNLNRVVLTGNLTADPELRTLSSGTAMCRMRIATNTRRRTESGWEDKPNYFDVVAWGGQAEACARFLSKGSPLAVDGRLEWREWEAQDGQKRQGVEIVAENVQFLSTRGPQEGRETVPELGSGEGEKDVPF